MTTFTDTTPKREISAVPTYVISNYFTDTDRVLSALAARIMLLLAVDGLS